jgi:hypothetical protein
VVTGLNGAALSAVLRLPLGSAPRGGLFSCPGTQPFYTRHAWRVNTPAPAPALALPAVLPRVFSEQISRQVAQAAVLILCPTRQGFEYRQRHRDREPGAASLLIHACLLALCCHC